MGSWSVLVRELQLRLEFRMISRMTNQRQAVISSLFIKQKS